jgi:hypothetical protein
MTLHHSYGHGSASAGRCGPRPTCVPARSGHGTQVWPRDGSEAIRECLAVGIDTIRHRDGVPGGRVKEVLGAIEGVRLLLELLGPPTFGTQRLLAHWASRDGTVKVSEEELMAELRNVSADEWEQAVVEAERDLSKPRMGPKDEEI